MSSDTPELSCSGASCNYDAKLSPNFRLPSLLDEIYSSAPVLRLVCIRVSYRSIKYWMRWLFVRSRGILFLEFTALMSAPLSNSCWTILTEPTWHATCKGVPWRGLHISIFVLLFSSRSSMIAGYMWQAAICKGAILVLCVNKFGSAS